jgi:hypothetical protein
MKVWWNGETYVAERSPEEKEAIARYYRSPVVRWYEAGYGSGGEVAGGALLQSGYYVVHHCGNWIAAVLKNRSIVRPPGKNGRAKT